MKKILFITAFIFSISLNAFSKSNNTIYVDVNGLVCDFCARALEKVFAKQESVEAINVDLDKKLVTINLKENKVLDNAIINQLITDSGYVVRGIRYEE